jgi:chemotaxis protein methyltransferase CheR
MSPVLADADFQALRRYLRQTAGLEFDDSRRTSLAHVMAERLRVSGATDMPAYLALLDRPAGAAERQLLLDAVTIQETFFHRARPQIDALRDHLLPDVLQRAARQGRKVTVWSAGCSTGEEAYTLAMLALEATERMADPPPVRVVGTDVSTRALEIARRACYAGRTIDLAEPGAVARWLRPADAGTFVVRDQVRELVEFAHHNLVIDPAPFAPGTVDLVVCRNVTIYFSRETTKALVGRFRDALVGEGWLLMGPAETLWQLTDAFTLVPTGEAFAYRPVAAAVATPRREEPTPTARPAPRIVARPSAAALLRTLSRTVQVRPPADVTPRPAIVDGPALLAQAREALEAADYARAADLAERAVGLDPLLTEAYVICGEARAAVGQDAEALQPLSRAVYLDQHAGDAWFLLAGSLARTGDRLGAARAYRAAADGLQHAPVEAVRRLLDGAPVAQLVQLCRRLADDLEGPIDRPADGAAVGAESMRRGA